MKRHLQYAIETIGLALSMTACGGGESTTVVQPTAGAVTSVRVAPTSATVTVGQQQVLIATPTDGAGKAISGLAITWSSSATSIASVDAAGTVTGVAAGNALVTASVSGKSASAAITVTPPTYDGRWNGTTAQGDSVAFTIVGSSVRDAVFKFRLTGDCNVGATTIHVIGPSGSVSGQQVTILSGSPDINASGSFSSFDAASGTGSYTLRGSAPTCTSTGATTWTAHKS